MEVEENVGGMVDDIVNIGRFWVMVLAVLQVWNNLMDVWWLWVDVQLKILYLYNLQILFVNKTVWFPDWIKHIFKILRSTTIYFCIKMCVLKKRNLELSAHFYEANIKERTTLNDIFYCNNTSSGFCYFKICQINFYCSYLGKHHFHDKFLCYSVHPYNHCWHRVDYS